VLLPQDTVTADDDDDDDDNNNTPTQHKFNTVPHSHQFPEISSE
jgi:hypothetical protein